ncbi:hypothetical protein A2U01_0077275, partial [Trifolium medium]|nr:hypothetical protein [Trifolium medium]
AARRYNTKVIQRKLREGDLVLKRPMGKDKGGKLAANWEGPFRIQEVFEGGAYRLETLQGEILPRTWTLQISGSITVRRAEVKGQGQGRHGV